MACKVNRNLSLNILIALFTIVSESFNRLSNTDEDFPLVQEVTSSSAHFDDNRRSVLKLRSWNHLLHKHIYKNYDSGNHLKIFNFRMC